MGTRGCLTFFLGCGDGECLGGGGLGPVSGRVGGDLSVCFMSLYYLCR